MNKKFVIYNLAGEILRVGDCPAEDFELQAGEGEYILEGEACCKNDSVDPVTESIVPDGRPNPPQSQSLMALVVETPPGLSVTTQLDLLWQAMDAGTYPKAEPFYSAVKATKEAS